MSAGTTGYRSDINGLRAVAILLVVLFHTGFGWVPGGFIGVDVFFVISGFLISGQMLAEHQRSDRISLTGFWARRARRLLPLSSLVIVVTVVLGMAVSSPLGRQQIATDATFSGLYLSNWHFAQQSVAYTDALVADGLFTQFWSLSIEEQFYVILPLLMFGVMWWSRRNRDAFVTRVFLVVSVLVGISFALSVWLTPSKGEAAYFLTYTRLWELGLGVLLAIVMRWYPTPASRAANALALAGLLTIIGSAFLFDSATNYPGWKALVPVTGTALVLAFAGRSQNWSGRFLSITPLVVIGTWSYGWYLWHWPMIALTRLAGRRWFPELESDAAVLFAIVLSLLLAAATYQLIENPIRYLPSFVKWPKRSLAMGAALTFVAALAGPVMLNLVDRGNSRITVAGGDESLVATMTPLEARQDQRGRCVATPEVSAVPVKWAQDACVFGDPNGAVTIALLGDSHAAHWYHALDVAGKERGWKVVILTKSGCPAIAVQVKAALNCSQWRQSVLKVLQGFGKIDAIIVSNAQYYPSTILSEDGSPLSRQAAISTWGQGSVQTYADLLAISKQVIRLGDIPKPASDVPDCLSENPTASEKCAIDLIPSGFSNRELIAAEKSNAPRGVVFLDPTALVCPIDPCPVVDATGIIKYRDEHHMTATFSETLAQGIGDLLNSVLRAR